MKPVDYLKMHKEVTTYFDTLFEQRKDEIKDKIKSYELSVMNRYKEEYIDFLISDTFIIISGFDVELDNEVTYLIEHVILGEIRIYFTLKGENWVLTDFLYTT